MASTFPTSQDNFTNPSAGSTLNNPNHATQHSDINDAVEAIEAKIGTGSSTPTNNKVLRANGTGTSTWAQADLTTDITGVLPIANGGTAGSTAAAAAANLSVEIGKLLYPVGCIYFSTNSTNPATSLGFGTWSAFGAGRVPVGFDSGQTEFDTDEETGGAKTHTLTTAEMPSHNHDMGTINRLANVGDVVAGSTNLDDWPGSGGPISATNAVVGHSWTGSMGNTGGGGAHNNLQPYIVVRMWKRVS